MRALAVVLVMALGAPSWAQGPRDAPTTASALEGVVLGAEVDQTAVARYVVKLETENAELKTAAKAQLHPLAVVGLVVLAAVAGGAAGFGIARVTAKQPTLN